MEYALICDIHANLPALEAVLADIDMRPGIGAIYHLGDLVGYAPWPSETVALLSERAIDGVAGNYDSTVVLGGLPFRIDLRPLGGHLSGRRVILVHGTPTLNTVYWTEDRPHSFCIQMAQQAGAKAGDLIAFGHTHLPWHREVEGVHFLNTGSVGRPKDGEWRAGYVLIDVDEQGIGIEMVRVEYDLARATTAIRESDLPDDFAVYLENGGKALSRAE